MKNDDLNLWWISLSVAQKERVAKKNAIFASDSRISPHIRVILGSPVLFRTVS